MLDEVSACKTAGAGDEDGRIERAAVHSRPGPRDRSVSG
jgi:hypothetical protein